MSRDLTPSKEELTEALNALLESEAELRTLIDQMSNKTDKDSLFSLAKYNYSMHELQSSILDIRTAIENGDYAP